MPNTFFQFKQFTIHQDQCTMKVTTDSCLFGAWVAEEIFSTALQKETLNILDIGTGTGLLSLMIAQKNPNVFIDAVEIDTAAAKQAQQNVFSSDWKNRINIIEADIKTFNPYVLYDVIVTNPPFYENELSSPHPKKNVAHHAEGLLLNELLFIIKKNLKKNGKFFILIPMKRQNEMENLISRNDLYILKKLSIRQTTDHSFTRSMICGITNPAEKTITSEMSIHSDNQQYTKEFINLLKDYYLNL